MEETAIIDLLQQVPTHTLPMDQVISSVCGKSEIEITNKERIIFSSRLKYMDSVQKKYESDLGKTTTIIQLKKR
ncbi:MULTISPECIES: hypothetical protein [unclassified Enterococcus]|uniref:hypothetical protein n=1 Tax=unclassified Enterococcus TaxID=2608891 RepID=UPI001CE060AD|nr:MULTISPECIES: hypothetical protein [unclassified Enterococcus]MCA5014454.1 hypothetical protein [Enterococcus sp. S23]MCA5017432.1 hypothetical protein [Enterococcus sp. S22(2020)]